MLGHSPQWMLDFVGTWGRDRTALISLTGDSDPELLSDLDGTLVAKSVQKEVMAAYTPLVTGRKVNWTIVSAPNEGWAPQVDGIEAGGQAVPQLRGEVWQLT